MTRRRLPFSLLVVLPLLSLFSLQALPLLADEGEWPPEQLAQLPKARWAELKGRGIALSAQDLWDGKGGGLMTAVLDLGGCTASFVSPDGLLVTNHHCAFGAIQLASTPEKNYLRDGFVARSRAEEVEARGGASRVSVVLSTADVTARVRGAGSAFAKAATDLARHEAVERTRKEIVAECEKEEGIRCVVSPFWDGAEYRLMRRVELRDVRLVYAPPRGVGDFGGEEDNFRWPRHTGDFTFLRAYVSPDGKPASFAKENVPYRPKSWIRVSPDGVKDGDPVMIAGFPGRTLRHLTASAVESWESWQFPLRSRTNADLIALLDAEGKKDPAVALKVAAQIKSLGNGETNARGQIEGLRRNGVLERTRREDAALAAFLAAHPELPPEVRRSPAALEAVLAEGRKGRDRAYFLGLIERGSGYLGSAIAALVRADERTKPDLDRDAGYQDRDLDRARQREKDLTRSLAPGAARKAVAYTVAKAMASPGDAPIRAFEEAFGKGASAAAIEEKLTAFDATTTLADEKARLAAVDASAESLRASNDPYRRLAAGLKPEIDAIRRRDKEVAGALLVARPLWLEGRRLLRASEGKALYPDANSTLRLAFASVKGYSPREAVVYTPRTTLTGVLEKESGKEPFAVGAKVLEKARAADFGRWAGAGGSVPVGFLTDGDTTGGNSGSPTLNGKGELVGLNFDRVWENVAGDFGWNPERSRNVNVDIRYALWLADRVDGASALLDELLGKR